MLDDSEPVPRKTRADGARNRALILEAATRVLLEKGAGASMDEIARAAGVGNGTLYRHFPTRTALVDAVCILDTQHLVRAAGELSASHAPLDALNIWLDLFIDYAASRGVGAEAVKTLVGLSSDLHPSSASDVRTALATLFDRAREDGSIAVTFDPLDILRAIGGIAGIGTQSDWDQNAKRLVAVLLRGFQQPAPR